MILVGNESSEACDLRGAERYSRIDLLVGPCLGFRQRLGCYTAAEYVLPAYVGTPVLLSGIVVVYEPWQSGSNFGVAVLSRARYVCSSTEAKEAVLDRGCAAFVTKADGDY